MTEKETTDPVSTNKESANEDQSDCLDQTRLSNEGNASLDISIQNLSLAAGNKTLLEDVSATFSAGKITLIVGPSGAGKSLLLRILAGLLKPVDGELKFNGKVDIAGQRARAGLVGVVFQQFALFDEFSSRANVDFARAHRHRNKLDESRENRDQQKDLLKQLHVPVNVRTSQLSGGQRQRLAIARALAFHPQAILYDEPTSGLDLGTARKVARMIRQTQEQFGTTSIIVTHDYESLLEIADEVYFLSPETRSLTTVPKSDWQDLPNRLDAIAEKTSSHEEVETHSVLDSIRKKSADFFMTTTQVALETVQLPLRLLPAWKSPSWGLRYLVHYLRLVAGPTAWIYLIIAGIIIGFVTTYFIFKFLPFASYTEPLLIDNLLRAMGFSLYRIFIPVLSTILVAARCGAAVASDIGSKQYGNQIDAMKTFGANPRTYLLNNITLSFVIGMPLLNMLCFIAAKYTSLVSFTLTHQQGPDYWSQYFHYDLIEPGNTFYAGTGWLIAKLLTSALGIALISYHRGASPKYSSTDVSNAVTSTILWSTLFVLVVHFVFAFYEF